MVEMTARQILNENSNNLKRFEELVNDALKNNKSSFETSLRFTESELRFLREELKYIIAWDRSTLTYDVSF